MSQEPDATLPSEIHGRRRARGWTLRALSERSGVSAGMLSDIERGVKSPTVRLAYQIARALECSITDLVAPTHEAPGPALAGVLGDEGGGIERRSYPDALLHGRLEVATYRLQPGATAGPMAPNRAGTIEKVVALDGRVDVVLDGATTIVEEGASLSHGVHQTEYRNPSAERTARFLVLVDTSRC